MVEDTLSINLECKRCGTMFHKDLEIETITWDAIGGTKIDCCIREGCFSKSFLFSRNGETFALCDKCATEFQALKNKHEKQTNKFLRMDNTNV